ncbi:MAG TPA: inositol monophosphatase family protein [Kiloniellales bacterium]|nr:inositol monophosphatase family protein [Kiloniellales bacterium]
MSLKSPLVTVMTRAAMKAARHLKRDFGEVENLQVSRKGPADFVSTADLKAERILREELERARPDYGFLMEETGASEGKNGEQRRWIVDPLDGTSNFLHGLPHFAISLALEERGEVLAAVILDPIKDELYTAEKGQGAFLNNRRIRVSGRRRVDEALFATGIPFKGKPGHQVFLKELEQIMAVSAGVRRWGTASLDLAYVAAGRFEGFWERGLESWDIAAGILLVREAGGQVSEIDGRAMRLDSSSILASNLHLQRDLTKLLLAADSG